MKLVTASEMKAIEKEAIENYGIPSIVLMEHAGKSLAEKCFKIFDENSHLKKAVVFSGKGNNGGDGFVCARHLTNKGIDVKVILLSDSQELKGDAKINFDILQKINSEISFVSSEDSIDVEKLHLTDADIIIDAIYGTGFKGKATGIVGKTIEMLSDCDGTIISVDLPSGIEADTGKINGPCVKADYTLTFGLPKIGLYLEPGFSHSGQIETVYISLPRELLDSENLKKKLITDIWCKDKLPQRKSTGHKGNYGHVFIVGGSIGLTGAVALSCEGALSTGAGLVTAGVPQSLNNIMEIKLTEIMTKPLPETVNESISHDAAESILNYSQKSSVLAIGPGISTASSIKKLLKRILPSIQIPVVIDADGLNVLAEIINEDKDFLRNISVPVVLTPHPGEMARLAKLSVDEVQNDRLKHAVEYATEWGVILVLKGAKTLVAGPDGKVYLNTTGNPGMATGGSGDVLTGVISSLIAQGMEPLDSAAVGVYLHGRAGDMAAVDKGMHGMTAKTIIEWLPETLIDMMNI
ncbi:MAG: NAD(P)H-hydrate dehydratase [Bacillota bacterium]|nr:NAD(P)H-hydrate dehydratase [Bacillota bacterium]